jgi:integrase/recombinase XerD
MIFFNKNRNIKINQVRNLYLRFCEIEKNFSKQSLFEYNKVINWIIVIIGDIRISSIEQKHISIIKEECYQRKLKETTESHNLSVLRELLRFCNEELELKTLEPEKIKRPRIPRKNVFYLTENELKKFFNSIPQRSTRDLRFRALMAVLISTGCRIGEALNLELSNIDQKEREALIVGKGNKQRKIYFNDWSLGHINNYIEKRGISSQFVFIAEGKNKKWDRNDAQRNLRNYRKKLRMSEKLTAHIIRHSYATNLLKKGVSLGHIQLLLGHSDIRTTSQHYLGILSDDEAKEAHKRVINMDSW